MLAQKVGNQKLKWIEALQGPINHQRSNHIPRINSSQGMNKRAFQRTFLPFFCVLQNRSHLSLTRSRLWQICFQALSLSEPPLYDGGNSLHLKLAWKEKTQSSLGNLHVWRPNWIDLLFRRTLWSRRCCDTSTIPLSAFQRRVSWQFIPHLDDWETTVTWILSVPSPRKKRAF